MMIPVTLREFLSKVIVRLKVVFILKDYKQMDAWCFAPGIHFKPFVFPLTLTAAAYYFMLFKSFNCLC